MGFPTLWRKWIKDCVGTATASVLVNGSPTDEFSLHRGLRQGDPLSPFLFLLAAEGFHVLMEALVANNLFNGFKVGGSDAVGVSHLQFADDTLILCDKSWANIRALRAILLLFQELSGLKVNFSKSLLVGVNVHGSWLAEAATALNCKVGSIPFVYLGLPIGGNASRMEFWKPLINRINSRLSSWKSKFLSLGGRLVLLKSVLSSLPVYALSFFKAPSAALRAEGWFQNHVSRSLGDGSNVLFWMDVWVGELLLRDRFRRLYDLSVLKGESVASMRVLGWEEEGEAWRWRRRLWAWEEELVGELRLLLQNVSFQVHLDHSVMSISLWHKEVPLKVVLFAWRLLRDRLPTKDNLHRRHVLGVDDQYCVGGCGLVETSNHLFLHCNIFGSVWNYIFQWIGIATVMPFDVTGLFKQFTLLGGFSKSRQSILQVIWFATLWEIWKERNNRFFNSKDSPIIEVVDRIKLLTFKWLKVQYANLPFNYHGWWLSSFSILGIG
ncbi:uncharacterized protein [Medicago truncatula]|uniref:uncharacterized protein n=1 Tax=Medicago truncatula TaxID=3880 RepID=UPI000D2F39C4|nr:uncharacterized protein LOC112422159 [Medicago truncatula]